MPAERLDLEVKLVGAAQLSHLWKSFQDGTASLNQLKEARKAFADAAAKKIPGTEQFDAYRQKHQELDTAIKQVTASMRGQAASGGTLHQMYFQLGTALREVYASLIGAFAAFQSAKFILDAARVGAQAKLLREEIESLAKIKGFNATALMDQLQQATHRTVPEIELLQTALRAIQLGNIDLNKLPAVMEKLELRSKLFGVTTAELFEEFIRVAETGSPRMMAKFGLMFEAQEHFAKKVGESSDKLGMEEKAAANVAAAIEALLGQHVALNTESEITIENIEKATAAWEKMKIALGSIVASPIGKVVATWALTLAEQALKTVIAFTVIENIILRLTGHSEKAKQNAIELANLIKEMAETEKAMREVWGMVGTTTKPGEIAPEAFGPQPLSREALKRQAEERKRQVKEAADQRKAEISAEDELRKLKIELTTDAAQKAELVEKDLHIFRMRRLSELLALNPKLRIEIEKLLKVEQARDEAEMARQKRVLAFDALMRRFPEALPRKVIEGKAPGILEEPTELFVKRGVMEETLKKWQPLTDVIASGFSRIGSTIQTQVVEKLFRAKSVLQSFFQDILIGIGNTLARLASSGLIAGILSLVTTGGFGAIGGFFSKLTGGLFESKQHGGWITEPSLTLGMRTGRLGTVAERAPEYVSPLTRFSAQPQMIRIKGEIPIRLERGALIGALRIDTVYDLKRTL